MANEFFWSDFVNTSPLPYFVVCDIPQDKGDESLVQLAVAQDYISKKCAEINAKLVNNAVLIPWDKREVVYSLVDNLLRAGVDVITHTRARVTLLARVWIEVSARRPMTAFVRDQDSFERAIGPYIAARGEDEYREVIAMKWKVRYAFIAKRFENKH